MASVIRWGRPTGIGPDEKDNVGLVTPHLSFSVPFPSPFQLPTGILLGLRQSSDMDDMNEEGPWPPCSALHEGEAPAGQGKALSVAIQFTKKE